MFNHFDINSNLEEVREVLNALGDKTRQEIILLFYKNREACVTDIAKNLLVSAGTIHVRVKKMEDEGVIKGSTLSVDYNKMGYTFIAYVGLFLENSSTTLSVTIPSSLSCV